MRNKVRTGGHTGDSIFDNRTARRIIEVNTHLPRPHTHQGICLFVKVGAHRPNHHSKPHLLVVVEANQLPQEFWKEHSSHSMVFCTPNKRGEDGRWKYQGSHSGLLEPA